MGAVAGAGEAGRGGMGAQGYRGVEGEGAGRTEDRRLARVVQAEDKDARLLFPEEVHQLRDPQTHWRPSRTGPSPPLRRSGSQEAADGRVVVGGEAVRIVREKSGCVRGR